MQIWFEVNAAWTERLGQTAFISLIWRRIATEMEAGRLLFRFYPYLSWPSTKVRRLEMSDTFASLGFNRVSDFQWLEELKKSRRPRSVYLWSCFREIRLVDSFSSSTVDSFRLRAYEPSFARYQRIPKARWGRFVKRLYQVAEHSALVERLLLGAFFTCFLPTGSQ